MNLTLWTFALSIQIPPYPYLERGTLQYTFLKMTHIVWIALSIVAIRYL